MLDLDHIDYDYIKEDNSFLITYRNDEFFVLAEKIEILPQFYEIVLKNGGEIIGLKDDFENEEDIIAAIFDLKEMLKDENFQRNVFKRFLNNFVELNGELTFSMLENYLFMLDKEDIINILQLK